MLDTERSVKNSLNVNLDLYPVRNRVSFTSSDGQYLFNFSGILKVVCPTYAFNSCFERFFIKLKFNKNERLVQKLFDLRIQNNAN